MGLPGQLVDESESYFLLIAVAMAGALLSMLLLRRHTPPARMMTT